MAFTIQTVVVDPTLITGNVRVGTPVSDPTLGLAYLRYGVPVLDPTQVQGNIRAPFPSTEIERLEKITASGTAFQSNYSSRVLPGVTASGTAIQYPTGFSAGTLQTIAANGLAISNEAQLLPLITASGTALNGSVTSTEFSTSQDLPYPIANGRTSEIVVSQQTVEKITASGTALNGALGTSSQVLQPITASSYGGIAAVGSSSLVLPGILARGYTSFAGASFSTIVLQTVMQGLSTYSNFPFNSLAKFNGMSLGASTAGLFNLTGIDDAGTHIDAAARFGVTDFNSSYRSRVERVYLGYRCSQDMVLRLRTDGTTVRDYRIPSNGLGGIHGGHVKLGRGVEARYWQFEVRNQNGADFSLNMLEAKRIRLARRIGGADA